MRYTDKLQLLLMYVTVRTDKPKRVQSYILQSLFNQATYTYCVSNQ